MTSEQRYLNDPQFRALVMMLEKFMHEAQFTGTELREAAILAAIHYEQTTVRDRFVYPYRGK